ncbi:MAG: ROK family protein [Alicyclobacillus sp.]|nr:ROK family protein [Alicyclobacillus sp.]
MHQDDGQTATINGHDNSNQGSGNHGIVTLDVGGTTIQSGIVCTPGRVLTSSILKSDSQAHASADVLLDHFSSIITHQLNTARSLGMTIVGVGLAFPGPFDYENGICLIRGLDKFDAIYGMDLRQHLSQALGINKSAIRCMNDADAFSLGEAWFGAGQPYQRAVYLTLGTGIGSAFIEKGRIVNDTAPFGGRVFQVPFVDGVADDYLSRRGILRLAQSLGYPSTHHDVQDIAQAAFRGDAIAIRVFEQFGEQLASVLAPICHAFQPDGIVLGGQISKSGALFLPPLRSGLAPWSDHIVLTTNGLHSTWRGLYRQFFQSLDDVPLPSAG